MSRFWRPFRYLTKFAANFIYNNIRQALKIIAEYPLEIETFKQANDIIGDPFPAWLSAELKFLLTTKRKEPQEQANRVSYAEALQRYWAQR